MAVALPSRRRSRFKIGDTKMPIENTLKLIAEESWREKNPTFEVEPEIVESATLQAKFFLKRWKKTNSAQHWTQNETRNNYVGLIGQLCFELTLAQRDIPVVPNNPIVDWRGKKNYDFKIPHIGTIEVKTTDYPQNHTRMMVKKAEWHNSNYVFSIKLADRLPSRVFFMGYATRHEVDKEFVDGTGTCICPNAPAKWRFLSELHSAKDFFEMMQKQTAKCWQEPQVSEASQ